MYRWTFSRCLCVAAAHATLSVVLLAPAGAQGASGGGTLGANHEVAIEIPKPSAADRSQSGAEPELDEFAATETEDGDRTAIDRAAASRIEPSENEQQPLVDAGHVIDRDAAQRMATGRHEPASNDGEQTLGLGEPNEREGNDSRFGGVPGINSDFIQVVGALAVVITLLLVFRFVMVRASGALNGGRPSGVLEVLARYPVARGQHMALIKLGRRILLVHQNGSAMNTLTEVSDPNEVAALLSRIEAGSSGRDADRFRSLLRQYQREQEMVSRHTDAGPKDVADGGRDDQTEIVDLTRSQMGGLRNLFGGKR